MNDCARGRTIHKHTQYIEVQPVVDLGLISVTRPESDIVPVNQKSSMHVCVVQVVYVYVTLCYCRIGVGDNWSMNYCLKQVHVNVYIYIYTHIQSPDTRLEKKH